MFEVSLSFIPLLFPVVICVCLSVVETNSNKLGAGENLLAIDVSVCYILKHKTGKVEMFIFIVLGVTSFSLKSEIIQFEK